jgi:hypothetical protein
VAELIVVRTYPEPVEAQLDRARLASEGIRSIVIEPTGYNPALTAAAGGVLLKIDPKNLARAEEILRDPGPDPSDADDETESDEVRCPRCELTYCAFERPTLRGMAPGAGASLFAVVVAGIAGRERKRWHCHKCEHVWDDQNEGPRRMTRLLPGDPRPVFRLRRAHPGMGLFLGIFAGIALGGVLASLGPTGAILALAAFVLSPVAGWVIGSSIAADVCSEPRCRGVLPAAAETCPGCKGSVAGRVSAAAEHYAAAGDFRRELTAVRAKDEARAKRKAKKKG